MFPALPAKWLLSGLLLLWFSCHSFAEERSAALAAKLPVDCLLPSQVRQLGSIRYSTARRAIKTTAADCARRGGEYVAYDRAGTASMLRVWLPRAKEGDSEAQTYVGETYERQTPADYASAASWYLKAAQQGHARAALNLGHLFERGLGVARNADLARYWYASASAPAKTVTERTFTAKNNDNGATAPSQTGRYVALIVGNNRYRALPALDTAVNDAETLARLLRRAYGFEVRTLVDATRFDVLTALYEISENLSAKDSLLLYYAGHGELDRVNRRGHWLPVDAEANNTVNWIPNITITDMLNINPAGKVLVIADSCYSGMMSRSALGILERPDGGAAQLGQYRITSGARTRTAMTSGGVAPVIDGLGSGHSIFFSALYQALLDNTTTLDGLTLYRQLSPAVIAAAAGVGFEQIPEYAPLQFAGHEGGDFIFQRIQRGDVQ